MTQDDSALFFAYAGIPELRAETLRDATEQLKKQGMHVVAWQHMAIEGNILISEICENIDAAAGVIADVSTMNSNVLFEAGYAVGKNKVLWLLIDETDTDALKKWNEISILATIGRVDYSGNAEKLVGLISDRRPQETTPKLFETLLAGASGREQNAVFAPALPVKFTAATALEKMLERQSHLKILASSDDLGLAPLSYYVKEIYRSSATIFHLLATNRVRATEHNARASFLAGIAHGLDLPVLFVVESGFVSPLDYKDMLYSYTSSASLQDHVKTWLETLPKTKGSNKRLGRLALDVELPLTTFGQYVAEYESKELNEYFVQTNEFQTVLEGNAKIFVGRKGTGKTATMSQAVLELNKDRRNLVVAIKPSSYELSSLVEVLERFGSDSNIEYLLTNLWSYLILTEIAIQTVNEARIRPAGIGVNTAMRDLEVELESMDINTEGDLSTRLEDVVSSFSSSKEMPQDNVKDYIAHQLKSQRLTKLHRLLSEALVDYDRVAVLIDNLDKTWESNSNYRLMSKFIFSLLTTTGKLESQFESPNRGLHSINLSLTTFLRTDIFDVVSTHAREPDKIGALSVQWHDAELLVRVLEERYFVNKSKKSRISTPDMWAEVFSSEVKGLPTRDYLLWRTLPRPRDFIYFANAAVTTAINRKHPIIQESDVLFAESAYSRFAIEALLVESEAQGFDLESILYEFAGLDSTLNDAELNDVLGLAENPSEVRAWLIRTSFLGLETDEGHFVHIEGETAARRKLKVAERLANRLERPLRYRVHPAFRGYLDIRDDDLHTPEITDITLTSDAK